METNTILDIRVQPKSSKNGIVIDDFGKIKVYLNAPPIGGRANKECIYYFSKKLKIAKSNISIKNGEKGRNKKILIEGMNMDEVMKLLKS